MTIKQKRNVYTIGLGLLGCSWLLSGMITSEGSSYICGAIFLAAAFIIEAMNDD